MTEIFGTAASGLSVAALFTNCVDCFQYVQLGRHFGQDFERCRLKIDIAQARLSRWGEAVAINDDPRFATASPVDAETRRVHSILDEIGLLFQSIRKTSKRYELDATSDDLAVWNESDMQYVSQQLHIHLGTAVRQRQKQTNLVKKAAWALYDAKHFDRLVEHVTGFVDDLERIWPVESARRQLARVEIEEVEDERALAAIQDIATDVDSILAEVAEQKVERIAGRNFAGKIGTQDEARVRVGNEFAQHYFGRTGVADQTTNTTDAVDARGRSRVHIGTIYGGRSIFDD